MKKRVTAILLVLTMSVSMLSGCQKGTEDEKNKGVPEGRVADNALMAMNTVNTATPTVQEDKYRNFYEIFPYSFCDSNDDGVGDLQGIISKLDYLNDGEAYTDTDLGITGIWLTPICQSPTYHKYDVVDYYSIDTKFGTMEDFERLVEECHKRGIALIFDLVVNHTSSQNPWFIEACDYIKTLELGETPSSEECPYVDYYVFTKVKGSGYTNVPGTEWYYESRFVSEMPDLNLDSEAVKKEISDIVAFWLGKGVDGFRLDAVTSYYTDNDQKNIEFLTWLNSCVKEKKADAYIVGECWTYSNLYASYYASGIDSFFNFDFATQTGVIANVLKGESSAAAYGKNLLSIGELIASYNENYIDAAFSSNHDNARAAGYYAGDYAEDRTKLTQAMAMMLGGCYFLYYGDEVGMKGAGDDENKRAPMQWSTDAQAPGMCDSVAKREYEMVYGSVETQEQNGDSILNYVKQGLKLRNTYPEIARGKNEIVETANENILVLKKTYEGSELLIVMNLSEIQTQVDLSGISINGKEAGDFEIAGTLLVSGHMVAEQDGVLNMPAYSIELLK